MSPQDDPQFQAQLLAYHEKHQDPEVRYQKLKTFLTINGYNVGHLLRLDENLLIEHAEAVRDSTNMCIERRDTELADLRTRLQTAEQERAQQWRISRELEDKLLVNSAALSEVREKAQAAEQQLGQVREVLLSIPVNLAHAYNCKPSQCVCWIENYLKVLSDCPSHA